ncbi:MULTISPECIES: hypothetical protein [Vibrio]|uniref:hypothetical protein n=1 Tax=Vibrio TaxID=662 RepID=UPI0014936D9B|nr:MULTISPECIES: hypothetical protein [Vibrio]MDN3632974.1 hypothetical protein [Vibrio lentus]
MINKKLEKTIQKKRGLETLLRYLRIKLKSRKNKNASLDVRYLSDHLKKDIGVYDKYR